MEEAEVTCDTAEEGSLLRILLRPEELGGHGLSIDLKPFGPGTFDARDRSVVDELQSPLYCDAPCVSFLWTPDREQALSQRDLARCRATVDEEHDGFLINFACLDMIGASEHLTSIEGEAFCSLDELRR